MRCLLVEALFLLLHCVQASWFPSDLIVWYNHGLKAIVVDKWLYVDGGEIHLDSDGPHTSPQNFQTFAVDLSLPWSTSSVNAIASNNTNGKLPIRGPRLGYDGQSIISYGGEPFAPNDPVASWAFAPDGKGGGNWTQQYTQGDNTSFSSVTRPAASLAARSPAAMYALGGFQSKNTDPAFASKSNFLPPLTGMVTYDFGSHKWTNQSTDGEWRANGVGQYVPNWGEQGIVIFMGGDASTSRNTFYLEGKALVPMTVITIYDIKTQKFHQQTASGRFPENRLAFCSVGVSAPDNSSFEIFIFGGTQSWSEPLTANSLSDLELVYILTLPAFTWIQVINQRSPKRIGHTCEVIGNRQMLSLGGWQGVNRTKDSFSNGLGIFDMTELYWKTQYDPAATRYQQSAPVKDYYASHSQYPLSWDDPAVRNMFMRNQTLSPKGSISVQNMVRTDKGKQIGLAVGLGIGCTLLLSLLLFILWKITRARVRETTIGAKILDFKSSMPEKQEAQELPDKPISAELYSGCVTELPAFVKAAELDTRNVVELP